MEGRMPTGDPVIGLHQQARVVAFAIGKGGVGKTSVSCNFGVILAANGLRVLLVVLDPQDNAGENLGYTSTGQGDQGETLFNALVTGQPLRPTIHQVRENLDVINSGPVAGEDLAFALRLNDIADSRLAEALTDVADDYDFILLDCPPFSTTIQRQALTAAQYVVVPCQADSSSFKGIALLAEEYKLARELNPDLTILGFTLFDVDANASKMRARVRTFLQDELGDVAPVFEAVIRHAGAAALDSRARGLSATELAGMVQDGLKVLRGEVEANGVPRSAQNLAGDYMSLSREILGAIQLQEARA